MLARTEAGGVLGVDGEGERGVGKGMGVVASRPAGFLGNFTQ